MVDTPSQQIHKLLSTEFYERLKLLILNLASISALLYFWHFHVFLVLMPLPLPPSTLKKKKHSYKLPVWGTGCTSWFFCSNLLNYGLVLKQNTSHTWVAGPSFIACPFPCRTPGPWYTAVWQVGDQRTTMWRERQNGQATGTAEFGKNSGFKIKICSFTDTSGARRHVEGPA